jgi:hypothetical protein
VDPTHAAGDDVGCEILVAVQAAVP